MKWPHRGRLLPRVVAVSLTYLLIGANTVAAATEYDPWDGAEVFQVTLWQSTRILQTIPQAASEFSGEELYGAGVTQLQDIQTLVPNLHFGEERGEAKITIRGVSNAQGTDQSTAVHLDGIYQGRARALTSLSFFDVNRVEVLRGPQGTLYGKNATAGSINILAKPPSQEMEASADFQIGTYDQLLARGVLNVPLVEDVAAIRISGIWENRDGYQKNLAYEDESGVDADDADDLAIRSQLRLTPSDQLAITLRSTYASKRGVGYALKRQGPLPEFIVYPLIGAQPIYAGSRPNPTDERKVFLDERGEIDNEMINGNVELEWTVPKMPLVGETELRILGSFTDFDDQSTSDQDYSDVPIAVAIQSWKGEEWVAEAQWTSGDDADQGWLLGLFHYGTQYKNIVDAPSVLPVVPPQPPPIEIDVPFYQDFERSAYSAAAFTTVWHSFTDQLRVEAGLRYSYDWKESSLKSPVINLLGSRFVLFEGVDNQRSDSWGAPSGNISLDYEFGSGSMAYARFATGYKTGTLNNDIAVLGGEFGDPDCDTTPNGTACDGLFDPEIADPETIYTLEAGVKNAFFDGRLVANLTGFIYWYDDLQVSQLFEAQYFAENAATARIWGLEIESQWEPVDGLTIQAQFAFLDTTYTDYEDCRDAKDLSVQDCSGNQLSRSPRYSGNVIAAYAFDLGRFGRLTPLVKVYVSDYIYFRPTNEASDRQDAYYLLDLRLGWQSPGEHFGIDFFVSNVMDKDVASTKIVGSSLLDSPLIDAYEPPRTAGARLSLAW